MAAMDLERRREYLNILAQQRYPSPQLSYSTGATALYDAVNSTPSSPATTPLTGINMAKSAFQTMLVGGVAAGAAFYLASLFG